MSQLKYFTDLILGKGFCIFIFFHFPDSSPSVLNGLHFYFSLRDSASREYICKGQRTKQRYQILMDLVYLLVCKIFFCKQT